MSPEAGGNRRDSQIEILILEIRMTRPQGRGLYNKPGKSDGETEDVHRKSVNGGRRLRQTTKLNGRVSAGSGVVERCIGNNRC